MYLFIEISGPIELRLLWCRLVSFFLERLDTQYRVLWVGCEVISIVMRRATQLRACLL